MYCNEHYERKCWTHEKNDDSPKKERVKLFFKAIERFGAEAESWQLDCSTLVDLPRQTHGLH